MGGIVSGPGSLVGAGTGKLLTNPIINPLGIFGKKAGQAAVDPLNLSGAFTPPVTAPAPPSPPPPPPVMPPGYSGFQSGKAPPPGAGGLPNTVITGPTGVGTDSVSTAKKTLLGG